jgi:hypothetical protein
VVQALHGFLNTFPSLLAMAYGPIYIAGSLVPVDSRRKRLHCCFRSGVARDARETRRIALTSTSV